MLKQVHQGISVATTYGAVAQRYLRRLLSFITSTYAYANVRGLSLGHPRRSSG